MDLIHTVEELRARLKGEEPIVLVPTMGNLHAGHIALVEEARKHGKCIVASVFVNRLQFEPGGDFDRYPRTLASTPAKHPPPPGQRPGASHPQRIDPGEGAPKDPRGSAHPS